MSAHDGETGEQVDALAEALGASEVIEIGPKGRAFSIGEALSLRSWFDRRQREKRGQSGGSVEADRG